MFCFFIYATPYFERFTSEETPMSMLNSLRFDFFVTGIKSQTRRKVLFEIAEIMQAGLLDFPDLGEVFWEVEEETSSGVGNGVAVLGVSTPKILKPYVVLAILDHQVDFKAPDERPVDIFAIVMSPEIDGPIHLQRMSSVSRLLKNSDLCESLRACEDYDALQILLTPSQQLMSAA